MDNVDPVESLVSPHNTKDRVPCPIRHVINPIVSPILFLTPRSNGRQIIDSLEAVNEFEGRGVKNILPLLIMFEVSYQYSYFRLSRTFHTDRTLLVNIYHQYCGATCRKLI